MTERAHLELVLQRRVFIPSIPIPLLALAAVTLIAGAVVTGSGIALVIVLIAEVCLWTLFRPSGHIRINSSGIRISGGDFFCRCSLSELEAVQREVVNIPIWMDKWFPTQAQVAYAWNPGIEIRFRRRMTTLWLIPLPHPQWRRAVTIYLSESDEQVFCEYIRNTSRPFAIRLPSN